MRPDDLAGPLDRHFAELLGRLASNSSPELRLAALLLSQHRTAGNICLPLEHFAGESFPEVIAGTTRAPAVASWAAKLRATDVVGEPGDFRPLILDQKNRLYLFRYWDYEKRLADNILQRLTGPQPTVELGLLRQGLERLFPATTETNWQKVAAFNAVMSNFSVITGGPGTGKTRTIVATLILLLEQAQGKRLRIALAAPSGKAAMRLKEAIQLARESLPCRDEIRALLPREVTTIHRLLGTIRSSPYFIHNAERPLTHEVVVIDEASMGDLALMAKLFAAIPAESRIILVGDKDQLTSVEAGFVLGDICHSGSTLRLSRGLARRWQRVTGEKMQAARSSREKPIQKAIVELKRNYRFAAGSGIYDLSLAINAGDADRAMAILRTEQHPDLTWQPLPSSAALPGAIASNVIARYEISLTQTNPAEALQRLSDFQVLAAVRKGPYGVAELNRLAELALSRAGFVPGVSQWYPGRPIIVTRNDYNLKLFNGDVGVTITDAEEENNLRVFFLSEEGKLRRVIPARLPEHETAYAITAHKSQGSEFARVLIVLPAADSPVLTRELLYTAVTRARQRVEIWATETTLRAMIARRITRTSGLRDALWD